MELRSTVGLWVTVRRYGLNVSCPYRAPDKSGSLATLGMTIEGEGGLEKAVGLVGGGGEGFD
jgi:hypothetical protein